MRAETGEDDAGAHDERANEADELDVVVPAYHWIDEDATAPGQAASYGPDERNKGILPLGIFDVRFGGCIKFLRGLVSSSSTAARLAQNVPGTERR